MNIFISCLKEGGCKIDNSFAFFKNLSLDITNFFRTTMKTKATSVRILAVIGFLLVSTAHGSKYSSLITQVKVVHIVYSSKCKIEASFLFLILSRRKLTN